MNSRFTIERMSESTRLFVDKQIAESWAGPYVVTRGILYDTRLHAGFTAVDAEKVIGYILYNIADFGCEITVLESLCERQGVGSALINAVMQTAKDAKCHRVWLITTNDNIQAIRFYQRFGFSLKAVHIHAIKASRKLKPQIPMIGNNEIPILHEFEFEMLLDN